MREATTSATNGNMKPIEFPNHKEAYAFGYSFRSVDGFMGYDTTSRLDGTVSVTVKFTTN